MRHKTLCRTCRQPTQGPHASWCSYSDGALSALRASLPASRDLRVGERPACGSCGYVKCGCTVVVVSTPNGAHDHFREQMERAMHDLHKAILFPEAVPTKRDRKIADATPDTDYARHMGWELAPGKDSDWRKGEMRVYLSVALEWNRVLKGGSFVSRPTLRLAIDAAEREIAVPPASDPDALPAKRSPMPADDLPPSWNVRLSRVGSRCWERNGVVVGIARLNGSWMMARIAGGVVDGSEGGERMLRDAIRCEYGE